MGRLGKASVRTSPRTVDRSTVRGEVRTDALPSLPIDLHGHRRARFETGDDAEQCRLAGTGRTHQGRNAVEVHVEVRPQPEPGVPDKLAFYLDFHGTAP